MVAKIDRIAVLGGGEFGVALARLAAEKSHHVMFWARDRSVCEAINTTRHHPTKLSQVFLPHEIVANSVIKNALHEARVVILAVPMAALSEVMNQSRPYLHPDAIVVCTAKGIEEHSLRLTCDIIHHELSAAVAERACFLSGPSFAIEIAMGFPTALTLASRNGDAARYFQEVFSRPHFRLYRSSDVIGACIGGALKNVMAIAAGVSKGLNLGRNALASLITRGLAEMSRLALAMGAKSETLSGLSGAGDLILSCTDDMSRNHRLGTFLAEGLTLEQGLKNIGSVVEGAKTARTIPMLTKKYGIEMPIATSVYRVLYEGLKPEEAISAMLSRKLKDETA